MESLYRGYVKTDGKKSLDKFKNGEELRTLEEVKKLKSYGGVLRDDVILIDIDDEENSEKLMNLVEEKQLNCKVYQTSRGKHFVFKNKGVTKNYTNVNLALGIKADIKVGLNNSYQVLKKDGAERFIEWDSETYDYLPKFLLPIKSNYDFGKLHEGSGRNSTLFKYILTLQSYDFDKEEVRETIRLINEFILDEPLSENEVDVILRDDAFSEEIFYKEGKFNYHKFCKFLISNHNIKRINGVLHVYKDGIYEYGNIELERTISKYMPNFTIGQRREALAMLELLVEQEYQLRDYNYIAFRNGLYNIKTDEFISFTPDIIITNKINWNYNPTSYASLTDEILNNLAINNKEIRMLIEEMIGYTFYRRNELRKAFILTGQKQNGKSTFLNILKELLGAKNTSVLDIKHLNDRFSTVMMVNKLANIGDDISNKKLYDTEQFKKIVSGEKINAEQKGRDKFEFTPYCKLIYSANNIPKLGDGDDAPAVLSRLVIVPFKAYFDSSTPDYKPFIIDDLITEESMEYLINIGITGLKRVLKNRKFTESEFTNKEFEEYKNEVDPVTEYLENLNVDLIIGEKTRTIYSEYVDYCLREGYENVPNRAFSRKVNNFFNLTTVNRRIDGVVTKVYLKK